MSKRSKKRTMSEKLDDIVNARVKSFRDNIFLSVNDSDYEKKVKEMVKEYEHYLLSVKNKSTHSDNPKEYYLTSPCYIKRRTVALKKYIPQIATKFKPLYPQLPIEDILIDMHSYPTGTLVDTSFMFSEKKTITSDIITLGVALFILDNLYLNDTLSLIMPFLPSDKQLFDDILLPCINFSDSMFPNDLICSMMYLIKNRNDTSTVYYNQKSASRYVDSTNNIVFNKVDPVNKEMNYRELMDYVLSLMPETTVTRAVDNFEIEYNKYLNTIFKAIDTFYGELHENIEKMSQITDEIKVIDKKLSNIKAEMSVKKPYEILYKQPSSLIKMNSKPFLFDRLSPIDTSDDETHRLIKKGDILFNSLNDIVDEVNKNTERYHSILHEILTAEPTKLDKNIDPLSREAICRLSVYNPYELLFGFFFRLDRGDDLPWLVESINSFVYFIIHHLPWVITPSKTLNEAIKKCKDESADNDVSDESFDAYYDENSRFYALNYTDYIDWKFVRAKRIPNEELRRLNYPQLLFHLSNTVPPRDMSCYDDDFSSALKKSGLAAKNVPLTRLLIETLYNASKQSTFSFKTRDTDSDSVLAQKEYINQLQNEVDKLKTALHTAEKDVKSKQNYIQSLENEAVLEHNELTQLRELLFNIQNQLTEQDNCCANITLPYATERNIVVYGGHATWLKSIKPLLPKVQFISPETNPNSSTFRNADVIWLQTNAMPHCNFYKIIEIARKNHIQVKYFSQASAEKCAIQLVLNEQEKQL